VHEIILKDELHGTSKWSTDCHLNPWHSGRIQDACDGDVIPANHPHDHNDKSD
jgi:hypothetical protein